MEFLHPELSKRIIGIFYDVYNELGYGFAESVYRNSMLIAFHQEGIVAQDEYPISVWFRGECVGTFKSDILVEKKILLELKSARAIDPAFESQLLNELRATPIELGLLLNFGPKPMFKRLIYDNTRKQIRYHSSDEDSATNHHE